MARQGWHWALANRDEHGTHVSRSMRSVAAAPDAARLLHFLLHLEEISTVLA